MDNSVYQVDSADERVHLLAYNEFSSSCSNHSTGANSQANVNIGAGPFTDDATTSSDGSSDDELKRYSKVVALAPPTDEFREIINRACLTNAPPYHEQDNHQGSTDAPVKFRRVKISRSNPVSMEQQENNCDSKPRVDSKKISSTEARQEWVFTLYDVDGKGIVSKDDIRGLVRSISDVLGSVRLNLLADKQRSQHEASTGAFKVKLTLVAEPANDTSACRASTPIQGSPHYSDQTTNQARSELGEILQEKLNIYENIESVIASPIFQSNSADSKIAKCLSATINAKHPQKVSKRHSIAIPSHHSIPESFAVLGSTDLEHFDPLVVPRQSHYQTHQQQQQQVNRLSAHKLLDQNQTSFNQCTSNPNCSRGLTSPFREYVNLSELDNCCVRHHYGQQHTQTSPETNLTSHVKRHCERHCTCRSEDKRRSLIRDPLLLKTGNHAPPCDDPVKCNPERKERGYKIKQNTCNNDVEQRYLMGQPKLWCTCERNRIRCSGIESKKSGPFQRQSSARTTTTTGAVIMEASRTPKRTEKLSSPLKLVPVDIPADPTGIIVPLKHSLTTPDIKPAKDGRAMRKSRSSRSQATSKRLTVQHVHQHHHYHHYACQ